MADESAGINRGQTVVDLNIAGVRSWHHLWIDFRVAAVALAQQSFDLEQREAAAGALVSAILQEHRAHVVGSIFLSASCVEAAVNDVFARAADHNHGPHIAEKLGQEARVRLKTAWPKIGKTMSSLNKVNHALALAGKPAFDQPTQLYQDVTLIFKLRNDLIHYKPVWYQTDTPSEHEKKLAGRFPLNPFYAQSGNPFFPDKCLGAGCAMWAAKSAGEFIDKFFEVLGL